MDTLYISSVSVHLPEKKFWIDISHLHRCRDTTTSLLPGNKH